MILAALSVLLLKLLLSLSTAYAPVASKIERDYYLTTLGKLYGAEKIAESVAKYEGEVERIGSFNVAERLWSNNKSSDLEAVHQGLLAERAKGLEEAPDVEAKATTSAIQVWLVINVVVYGLLVLIWHGLRKICRKWSAKVKQYSNDQSEGQRSSRSKAGWSGRV